MPDTTRALPRQAPSPDEVQARWQRSLALFELWARIWAEQPDIARRSGQRVEELMMPIDAVWARYIQWWSAPR
jgi:hypothetical protein